MYDLAAVLCSIQSLLNDPNPNSPANAEASNMFQTKKREYNRRVRECVEESWENTGDGDSDSDDDNEEEA